MAKDTGMKKQLEVKQFKLPDTMVIIFIIMIFVALLTYIIPAGTYDTVIDAAGEEVVDPNSFHYIARSPVSILNFFKAPLNGLKKQSSMILSVIVICSCFRVVNDTKALSNFFTAALNKLQHRAILLIPVIMTLFGILGSTGALVNSTVAFIPIGLVIASQLGMDRISAMAIIYLATFAGYGSSFMSVTSVQLAQEIAGVPLLSGAGFRAVVSAIIVLSSIIYTIRYSSRVMKDKTKSFLYGTEMENFEGIDHPDFDIKLTWVDLVIVILTFGTFGLFVWGAVTLDWGQDMMAAMMLMVAIASGFLSGMNGDKIAKSFKNGAKGIIPGMVQVGFATSIGMMMESGNIIHTVVNVIAAPLSHMTPMLAAIIMFLFGCFVLNFVVTSSSGQAAIIMPVLAPLSDVIGLSRQVAVLAYQYGDGMSNVLYPVSSTLVASLGIAGVPYQKWVRFVAPLFGIWCIISMIAIAVAVVIGL